MGQVGANSGTGPLESAGHLVHGVFCKRFLNPSRTSCGLLLTFSQLRGCCDEAFYEKYLHCLPERLRERGYASSWVYGSDSNFDGQTTFLPSIGFERLVDESDFPASAIRLD